MKKLIHFNEKGYNSAVALVESLKELLVSIIEEFNEMDIPDFEPKDFQLLLNDPKKLVFEKITAGKELEFLGRKVSIEKVYEFITPPAGEQEFIKSVGRFFGKIDYIINNDKLGYQTRDSLVEIFQFDESGVLYVTEDIFSKLKKAHEVYVESDAAIAIHEVIEAMVNVINKSGLIQKYPINNLITLNSALNEVLGFDAETRQAVVSVNAIKAIDHRRQKRI